MGSNKDVVFLVTGEGIGSTAEQPLKDKLTQTWLRVMEQNHTMPRAICFYTGGVKLACEGSVVLDELASLEARGVRLILCQTCLDYFHLRDRVRVGIVGGMGDIVTAMWQADSVITV
jgi:hypothetical protein